MEIIANPHEINVNNHAVQGIKGILFTTDRNFQAQFLPNTKILFLPICSSIKISFHLKANIPQNIRKKKLRAIHY